MKKTTLLWGALLAAFALQACSNTEDSAKTDPAASETPSDSNLAGNTGWTMPDGSQIVMTGDLGLGSDGQIVVQSAYTSGTFVGNGLGIFDTQVCGDGRNACTAACPPPCIAPGYPSDCGACSNGTGTFAGGVITANLTLVNIAGGNYGSCAQQDKTVCDTSVADSCLPVDLLPAGPGGLGGAGEIGCNGLPVGTAGTLNTGLNPYNTVASGIMNGFCQDGVTACVAANSDAGGNSITCGGLGNCTGVGEIGGDCYAGADNIYGNLDDSKTGCVTPATATCTGGPYNGDGRCWSGCGACTAGHAFNCAAFVYTGSNANAGAATGDLKCTGAPYSINSPTAGLGSGVLVGQVADGASTAFVFRLNSSDNSFCVHTFVVAEDPYARFDDSLVAPANQCAALATSCGDGVISLNNGEVCEPTPDYADITPLVPNDLGCTDALSVCVGCSACIAPGSLCGNGAMDAGEACDDGNNLNGDCCSATCQFEAAGASCGGAPGVCEAQDTCNGAGVCINLGFLVAGAPCGSAAVTACDAADTCAGGIGVCNANNAADGTACGGAPGTCQVQDTCTAGACVDNGFSAALTPCNSGADTNCDNPDTCAGGSATCNINNEADGTVCDNAPSGSEPEIDTCLTGVCVDPTPVCGNGAVQAGEQCDDGNVANGDCCSSTCQFEAAASACGGSALACDALNTCNGAGTCVDNIDPAGTNCAAAGANATCDPADTCDGVGTACPVNLAGAGTACGGSAAACDALDVCDGAGACPNIFDAAGTACGSPATTSCDNPDTCAGGADICNVNNLANGTVCVASASFGCTLADTCTTGVCVDNGFAADNSVCDNAPSGTEPDADTCQTGICTNPISGTTVTAVVARKGTSPGYGDPSNGDYNNGMTTGVAGATNLYGILPNDPAVTTSGTDLVVLDVTLSGALIGGETVDCEWQGGALFTEVGCVVGASSCIAYGSYPDLTNGNTTIQVRTQSAVNPSVGGIGAAVAPDEANTAMAGTVRCRVNLTAYASQGVTVRLGYQGWRDEATAAGAGSVTADFFIYCSNGASEQCGAIGSGDPDRGVAVVNSFFHFNPAVITSVGAATTPTARTGVTDAYNQVANGTALTPGPGNCSTAGSVTCANPASGVGRIQGVTVGCNGHVMRYVGSCALNYAGTTAGQSTFLDPVSLAADFSVFTSDVPGNPIRGIDLGTLGGLPSSQVRGTIIFQ